MVPATVARAEQLAPPFRPLHLSLHPRRPSSSEELVFEWMQIILQGKMPLDFLTKELPELSEEDLKSLFSAASKGRVSTRNKALTVLAYSRGINSSPICSFLKISKGSLFRYWRDFRSGGTEKLFFRKPRCNKKANNQAIKDAVFSLLHSPPSAHGFNRTTWRLADMKAVLGKECNGVIS